jgi:hypothetical protein
MNPKAPAASTLWSDIKTLSQYDIVMLSCEGQQNLNTKSVGARANLQSADPSLVTLTHVIYALHAASNPAGPEHDITDVRE